MIPAVNVATTRPPIPRDLRNKLPNQQCSPWVSSLDISPRLNCVPGRCYRVATLLPTDHEYQFILRYFQQDPPPNRGIREVRVIYNNESQMSFEIKLSQMEREAPGFPPGWDTVAPVTERRTTMQRLAGLTQEFNPFFHKTQDGTVQRHDAVKSLPLWHGTTRAKADNICETGMTYFGKSPCGGGRSNGTTDEGYFGRGIYLTSSPSYASKYSDGTLLLAWAAMREPFPIVSDIPQSNPARQPADMRLARGQVILGNYNAHYIPVRSVNPGNPGNLEYYPCAAGELPRYDEFVVRESAQTLVRYQIDLEDIGPRGMIAPTTELVKLCQEGNLQQLLPLLNPDFIHQATRTYNPDLDTAKHWGWTLLHEAALHGHIPIMEAILREIPDLLTTRREDGYTPFHAAAQKGHLLALQWLYLQRREFITTYGDDKYTPLHAALEGGDRPSIAWLVQTAPQLLELKLPTDRHQLADDKTLLLLDVMTHATLDVPELDLRNHRLTSALGGPLGAYLATTRILKTLRLGGNHLGDLGLQSMAEGLSQARALSYISLNSIQLTEGGAQAIATILRCSPSLEELDLQGNFIGDEGAVAIAAVLKNNTHLKTLCLNDCKITDVGGTAFVDALGVRTTPLTIRLLDNRFFPAVKAMLGQLATHKVIT